MLTVVGVTVVLAFVASQISPAWTTRYFAVVFGPVVLVAGHAVVRAAAWASRRSPPLVFLFAGFSVRDDKENAKGITAGHAPT